MEKCSVHDEITNKLDSFEEKIDKKFKELTEHFDKRHDKTLETITQNRIDIAVLKTKQMFFAALAGVGGSQLSKLYDKFF